MENISKQIAKVLKTLRQDRGWSLDMAAQATGVSKAMLGQIEREESSPTIATLWKIASGFQVAYSAFLEEIENNPEAFIHRESPTHRLHPADDKIRVATLFPFDKQLNCEIFALELLPGCEHLSAPHEPGIIEHVLVIDGPLEVLVQGEWHPFQKGEALRFNANQAHGYRNQTSRIASFYNIIHYPNKR
jgi:transcriptional regulator with XRE-family HTH domain